MAHNLLKKGHPLVVFDLSQDALNKVQAQAKALNLSGQRETHGAAVVSLEIVVSLADVCFCCVCFVCVQRPLPRLPVMWARRCLCW